MQLKILDRNWKKKSSTEITQNGQGLCKYADVLLNDNVCYYNLSNATFWPQYHLLPERGEISSVGLKMTYDQQIMYPCRCCFQDRNCRYK